MVYKIIFEYDGTDFYGLERQKNLKTIAGEFEKVLEKIFASKLKVIYASRTDKGVSAENQVASFVSEKNFNLDTLTYKLNRLLDNNIRVKKIEIANNNFKANSNVLKKTYRYSLFLAPTLYPIEGKFCSLCYTTLDIKKIKNALKYFVGTHDFSSFCSANCEKENKVRTIYKFKITNKKVNKNNLKYSRLDFYITGNGFLQHMVRIIIGTLINIGSNKLDANMLPQIFENKNRNYTKNTVSASGLTLIDVEYKKTR